jgi:hypothetical protein
MNGVAPQAAAHTRARKPFSPDPDPVDSRYLAMGPNVASAHTHAEDSICALNPHPVDPRERGRGPCASLSGRSESRRTLSHGACSSSIAQLR